MNPRTLCAERRGEVIAIDHGLARIRLEPAGACNGCASRGGCASTVSVPPVVSLPVPPGTAVGRRVTLSLPETSLVAAALLGYLLPGVCLLLGALGANLYSPGDASAVAGAGAGFAAGILIARLIHRGFPGSALVLERPVPYPLPSTPGDHS